MEFQTSENFCFSEICDPPTLVGFEYFIPNLKLKSQEVFLNHSYVNTDPDITAKEVRLEVLEPGIQYEGINNEGGLHYAAQGPTSRG